MSVKVDKDVKPSEQLAAAAKAAVEITDARGRKITIAKPGILQRMAFLKAMGDQSQTYLSNVGIAIYVTSIDGEDILPPKSEAAALAILAKLDDDGFDAVNAAAAKHFAPADPEASENAVKE